MPDDVAAPAETTTDEATTQEAIDPSALAEELATLKRRLSGKDSYYARKDQEHQQTAAELEALRKWKLEKEQADMTEVQRLQAERDRLAQDAEAARAEARRARLARDFPLTFEALGDKMPADEEALAILETRLKVGSDDDVPRIDPNNPRRTVAQPLSDEEIRKAELGRADDWLRSTLGR